MGTVLATWKNGQLSMTPEQEAELLAWRRQVRAFNLEAVRRQMEEGIP